jgi:hypothetical protein
MRTKPATPGRLVVVLLGCAACLAPSTARADSYQQFRANLTACYDTYRTTGGALELTACLSDAHGRYLLQIPIRRGLSFPVIVTPGSVVPGGGIIPLNTPFAPTVVLGSTFSLQPSGIPGFQEAIVGAVTPPVGQQLFAYYAPLANLSGPLSAGPWTLLGSFAPGASGWQVNIPGTAFAGGVPYVVALTTGADPSKFVDDVESLDRTPISFALVTAVPEPTTTALLTTGVLTLCLAACARRRQRVRT